jgi:hypothetical protein
MRGKIKIVSAQKWNDAVAFLAKDKSAGHALSEAERDQLRQCFRGPFSGGLQPDDAAQLLTRSGWRVNRSLPEGA